MRLAARLTAEGYGSRLRLASAYVLHVMDGVSEHRHSDAGLVTPLRRSELRRVRANCREEDRFPAIRLLVGPDNRADARTKQAKKAAIQQRFVSRREFVAIQTAVAGVLRVVAGCEPQCPTEHDAGEEADSGTAPAVSTSTKTHVEPAE